MGHLVLPGDQCAFEKVRQEAGALEGNNFAVHATPLAARTGALVRSHV